MTTVEPALVQAPPLVVTASNVHFRTIAGLLIRDCPFSEQPVPVRLCSPPRDHRPEPPGGPAEMVNPLAGFDHPLADPLAHVQKCLVSCDAALWTDLAIAETDGGPGVNRGRRSGDAI